MTIKKIAYHKKAPFMNELSSSLVSAGAIDAFRLSSEGMIEIINAFHREMHRGLSGKRSSLAMLPTFVDSPTGKERGVFLALDLGGSIFRVLMVYLPGNGRKPRVIIEKYNLRATESKRKRGYDYTQGSANELFAAIARYIKIFLTKHAKRIKKFGYKKPYPLGFTFSFSLKQTAIDQAILKKPSKGFRLSGLANKDVVQFLRRAISAQGLNDLVEVVSLNNDTVGTLVTGAHRDADCDIGGIVGTGTNFCYREMVENIRTLTGKQKARYGKKTMIINIESGNFNEINQNAYDKLLDRNSTNRGEHITEKMVSGLYLGELTRLLLLDLIRKGLLFQGQLTKGQVDKLSRKGGFPTPLMTKMAEDDSDMLKGVHTQLLQWGIKEKHIRLEDKKIIKQICLVVPRRAARITACVVFAIVTHVDKQVKRDHTVAIDGSLFEKYPAFKEDMRRAIKEVSLGIFRDDRSGRISLKLTPDGSGIGAAIIAGGSSKQIKK